MTLFTLQYENFLYHFALYGVHIILCKILWHSSHLTSTFTLTLIPSSSVSCSLCFSHVISLVLNSINLAHTHLKAFALAALVLICSSLRCMLEHSFPPILLVPAHMLLPLTEVTRLTPTISTPDSHLPLSSPLFRFDVFPCHLPHFFILYNYLFIMFIACLPHRMKAQWRKWYFQL